MEPWDCRCRCGRESEPCRWQTERFPRRELQPQRKDLQCADVQASCAPCSEGWAADPRPTGKSNLPNTSCPVYSTHSQTADSQVGCQLTGCCSAKIPPPLTGSPGMAIVPLSAGGN